MRVVKPPEPWAAQAGEPTVFLAGSIEMGAADDWQTQLAAELGEREVCLVNPRRDAWDSSWEQSIDNPIFREQVEWELDGIARADHVVVYFAPGTKAPITLLELGVLSATPERALVCCPAGFWRKGNVDVVCARFGLARVSTFGELVAALRARLGG